MDGGIEPEYLCDFADPDFRLELYEIWSAVKKDVPHLTLERFVEAQGLSMNQAIELFEEFEQRTYRRREKDLKALVIHGKLNEATQFKTIEYTWLSDGKIRSTEWFTYRNWDHVLSHFEKIHTDINLEFVHMEILRDLVPAINKRLKSELPSEKMMIWQNTIGHEWAKTLGAIFVKERFLVV